jgi:hypothetical protein
MALSDAACRAAKPGTKLKKLSDAGGLQLWIQPSGTRLWRVAYPAERSAKRYAQVLLALDGWLDGRPHREIAIGLFGKTWVDRAWNDTGNHLRDRVRRAIRHGRNLMDGNYRRFLG